MTKKNYFLLIFFSISSQTNELKELKPRKPWYRHANNRLLNKPKFVVDLKKTCPPTKPTEKIVSALFIIQTNENQKKKYSNQFNRTIAEGTVDDLLKDQVVLSELLWAKKYRYNNSRNFNNLR